MVETTEGSFAHPWLAPTSGGVGALASWTAPDGRPRLASSGTDGTIQIWDPERAVMIDSPLVRHTANVLQLVSWSWAGGRLLASASEDGTIFVWDVDAEAPSGTLLSGHNGWVSTLAFWNNADGRPRLASAGEDGTVRIWDPLTGEQRGPPLIEGQQRLAALASWSTARGTRLAVGDDAGKITVWDPDRCEAVGDHLMRHNGKLWTLVAWTAVDGTPRLASGGHDGSIRVWNPATGREVVDALRGHTNWVPTLATWTTAGHDPRLVSVSTDGTVRVWDGETGAPVGTPLTGLGGSIALPAITIWVATDGRRRLALVAEGGAIRSYDIDTGQAVGEPMVGHIAGMWALTRWCDADGTRLARGGDDGLIRIWNTDTGQVVGQPLAGHTAAVWALVAWSESGGATRLASTGDDGTVRIWDVAACAMVGEPLAGHAGWVPGLAVWQRPDGSTALASAGIDGTIRLWDPASRIQVGSPIRGHNGWALVIVAWQGRDGVRLASGGDDGTVRLWDPVTGTAVGQPLTGHTGWVRALAIWQDGARTLLVSGSYDGTIRVWNAETGEMIGGPLIGHTGRVCALATWTAADGGARLASAGSDGVICLWDLESLASIGDPLGGHAAGIWALCSWSVPGVGVRLASAGQDGSVRLWDPESGHAVRTIEIGPVAIWGISDAPMRRDLIGRQSLADAIADQLCRPPDGADSLRGDGPTVVSLEGPWGCGKSTLMNLVRERLPAPPPDERRNGTARHLTVRAVLREIRGYAAERAGQGAVATKTPTAMVTAWFNPWAYQSGEQVWVGLANEIIEAAADVLYPTEPDRERYWLARNISRIDRYALRRSLHQRTRSPILGLGMAALVAPVAISIVQLDQPIQLLGLTVTPFLLAMSVAMAMVLAGAAHTAWRRWFGKAVTYLPTELLNSPVGEGANVMDGEQVDADADPLRRARTGTLYLHQHNIGDLIDDLASAGYSLVVFVDDIDRCRPSTIAEVFEEINLFLSNVASRSGLRAHFVVGLDSAVVASHLDRTYGRHADPTVELHGEDPTPGWAFLRKLIQLPVLVPQISDGGVQRLVDVLTKPEADAAPPTRPAGPGTADDVWPAEPHPAQPPADGSSKRPQAAPSARHIPRARTPMDTFTWRSAEGHPAVRDLLVRRLSGQSQRSIREAKRLINVWQFYERIMEAAEPLNQPDAMIVRARRLLVLAEIITRWPALQRSLHRHIDGCRGLQLLAAATDSNDDWQRAVAQLGMEEHQALTSLRTLLREHEGRAVADLAAQLM